VFEKALTVLSTAVKKEKAVAAAAPVCHVE
jgi:hypothetical protein